MRYLVLTAALALAAGCGDTTSPTTSSTAVVDAAASGRGDLRRARESLIAAGNAVSAAIGEDGVAAGLGDALAADVILLSPRKPAISGRLEAAAFLSTGPIAPRALSWEVIFADVAADAQQGYTCAHGSSTLDFGAGPAPLQSFFLIYWRRTGRGDWDDVSSRTVDTHVAVLRRKLGHRPDEPGYIVTVAKAGYRLLSLSP